MAPCISQLPDLNKKLTTFCSFSFSFMEVPRSWTRLFFLRIEVTFVLTWGEGKGVEGWAGKGRIWKEEVDVDWRMK